MKPDQNIDARRPGWVARVSRAIERWTNSSKRRPSELVLELREAQFIGDPKRIARTQLDQRQIQKVKSILLDELRDKGSSRIEINIFALAQEDPLLWLPLIQNPKKQPLDTLGQVDTFLKGAERSSVRPIADAIINWGKSNGLEGYRYEGVTVTVTLAGW